MTRQRRSDHGATAMEFAALIMVSALVISTLLYVAIPDQLARHLPPALCRLFGGNCPPPSPDTLPNGAQLPKTCVAYMNKTEKSNNFKIIVYRRNKKEITQIDKNSDGSIWETTGKQTGNGFDIKAGLGGKVGGVGLSGTAGVEGIWQADKQTRLQFKNEAQRQQFLDGVEAEQRRLAALAYEDPWRDWPSEEEIKAQVAQRLGIPRVTFSAKGFQGGFGADGTLAVVNAKYKFEGSDQQGERLDDNGTADPKDDILTKVYSTQDKHSGEIGIDPLKFKKIKDKIKNVPGVNLLSLEGKVYGDKADAYSFEVQYRNGQPIKLVIVERNPWAWQTDWSAGASKSKTPDKGFDPTKKAGPKGNVGNGPGDGGMSVKRTEIDLTEDPGALDAFQNWNKALTTGPFLSPEAIPAAKAFNQHVIDHGVVTRANYTRRIGKDGWDISGSYGIELGAYEDKTDTESWTLEDGEYLDPTTGEWRPWTQCKK